MRSKILINREPYKYLFPMGALIGILGSALWPLFAIGQINVYPVLIHGNLMFFGMMWCFVAGFLMTAVPKMTNTFAAHPSEIALAISLAIIQIILNLFQLHHFSFSIFGLQCIFVLFFLVRRFLLFRRIPFPGFLFLPAAFTQALLGIALYHFAPEHARQWTLLLSGEAFLTNLICGLGGRLIPVISRHPNALLPHESTGKGKENWWLPLAILLSLNLSYWLQIGGLSDFSYLLKLLSLLAAAIFLLQLMVLPLRWTVIGVGLKLGVLFLLLGQFLNHPHFSLSLTAQHLMYIGGFTLITFMVATRVMVAHGGQNLEYEVHSKRILFVALSFALAGVLRFMGGSNFTNPLISISATFFILASMAWIIKFILIHLSQESIDESC